MRSFFSFWWWLTSTTSGHLSKNTCMYVWWLHLLYKRLEVLNPFVHEKFLNHCITSVVINGVHTTLLLLSTRDNYYPSFKMIIVTNSVTKLLQCWILWLSELNILISSDISPMHLIIIIWKTLTANYNRSISYITQHVCRSNGWKPVDYTNKHKIKGHTLKDNGDNYFVSIWCNQ